MGSGTGTPPEDLASIVISDSSGLIALAQIGQLNLLPRLFQKIIIPPAVLLEIPPTVVAPAWLVVQAPGRESTSFPAALGPGERQAITLAFEVQPDYVLLDDLPARRFATRCGLTVIGTVGILLRAKERGLIPAVMPLLDALIGHSFHISAQFYEIVRQTAGE